MRLSNFMISGYYFLPMFFHLIYSANLHNIISDGAFGFSDKELNQMYYMCYIPILFYGTIINSEVMQVL